MLYEVITALAIFKNGCPTCFFQAEFHAVGKEATVVPEFGGGERHGRLNEADDITNKFLRFAAEGQFKSLRSAKKVGNHREVGIFHFGAEQRRTTFSDDAAMYLGNFQIAIVV